MWRALPAAGRRHRAAFSLAVRCASFGKSRQLHHSTTRLRPASVVAVPLDARRPLGRAAPVVQRHRSRQAPVRAGARSEFGGRQRPMTPRSCAPCGSRSRHGNASVLLCGGLFALWSDPCANKPGSGVYDQGRAVSLRSPWRWAIRGLRREACRRRAAGRRFQPPTHRRCPEVRCGPSS